MTLREKQSDFMQTLGEFLVWIYEHPGWSVTMGEGYRSNEQAEINAMGPDGRRELIDLVHERFPQFAADLEDNVGSGIRSSLHNLRLAIDLQFFINGVYQSTSEAYRPLGEYWESVGGTWGGRFHSPDGNHFSLEWQGVR